MQAIAKATDSKISFKNSVIVCSKISRKRVDRAKQFLQDLIAKRKSIDGQYHTNVSKKILEVLQAAEANAKQKNLAVEKLFIKVAKANKGYKLMTPKSRFRLRGRQSKMTNLEIIVEER